MSVGGWPAKALRDLAKRSGAADQSLLRTVADEIDARMVRLEEAEGVAPPLLGIRALIEELDGA